ncbi:MAG TPA: LPXTG cell wall anchor domain-containing protein [Actinomycetota bacterium]|nr:LPXTG cell wall anchor domain-containing protein [Actinomycetota bacterium]
MRTRRPLKALLVLAALVALGAAPASAAQTLVLTCTICSQVIATGSGLPANSTVRLTMTDVVTGQEVAPQIPVQTDAQGKFLKKVNVDLYKHPSLESSVWASNGQVLVIAAHNRFNSPCKGHSMDMGNMLPMTGSSHAPVFLGISLALLAVGAVLLGAARRRTAP